MSLFIEQPSILNLCLYFQLLHHSSAPTTPAPLSRQEGGSEDPSFLCAAKDMLSTVTQQSPLLVQLHGLESGTYFTCYL